MNPVKFLGDALRAISRAVSFLWTQQGVDRRALVDAVQQVCSRCEDAYSAVITALRPVKDAFGKPADLSGALREFASDAATRARFKPDQLCGDIDQLLQRLASNADFLKYSLDVRNIQRLRNTLAQMNNYDGALRAYYDEYAREMDSLATELQLGPALPERVAYAQHLVKEFEGDLAETLRDIQAARQVLVNLV